jgi:Arc/MetJ-type ribon-helix-helix transcriptional regulator
MNPREPAQELVLDPSWSQWYQKGMKRNTKGSITLPAEELKLVKRLKARLKLKSNVEVVRAGLRLLCETTERDELREQFRAASLATRESLRSELEELDHLSSEGVD